MNVYLFQFTKKINSTARPALADGKEVICQLKEETSFLYPTIKVSPDIIGGTFSPSLFNYAYIPYWQRYYYIKDWVYLNGTWECSCAVDVLASFKSAIGGTSAYIIRAASQYNGDIIDGFYPTTSVYAIRKQSVSSDIYHTTLAGGSYVLGCINNQSSNRFGAVTYYALTDSQMASVLNYLFSSNIYNNSNISEMGEGLYKSLFDPFQYIVSCMWFPYPTTAISSGTTTDVKVGYWSTGINGKIANYLIKEIGFKTYQPIYRHPQIARGAYLDHAPYTRLTLYYAPFGEIPIDTSFMQFGNNHPREQTMQAILLGKFIGMAPDADACLSTKELHMAVGYQEAFVFTILVRLGEQAILVAVTEHHDGVVTTYCTLHSPVGA